MLKLTNSFCRYFRVTSERVSDRIHVRRFTHFSCTKALYTTVNTHNKSLLQSFIQFSHCLRLYVNIKKRIRLKKPVVSINAPKNTKQMSEPLRPSQNHTSFGGQFIQISEDDNASARFDYQVCCDASRTNSYNSSATCVMPADFRVWEPMGKKSNNNSCYRFTVVSYNVLAQYLLEWHPNLYTECCPHNLIWKERSAKLYTEILSLSPDILCFQEVQVSHLNTFYYKFEEIGYTGIFKRKTGQRHDGCAIYFKKSMFELQDQVSVEYYQPDVAVLNRDNIGIIAKLAPRGAAGPPLVVATTHLLFNPNRADVRLAQMQVLLAELDRFAYCGDATRSGHLPIILTGDFNSTPDSIVVQLLDRGRVRAGKFRHDSDGWKRIGVTDNCQHLTVHINRPKGQPTDFSMTKIYNSEYSSAPLEGAGGGAEAPGAEAPGAEGPCADGEYSELFNTGVLGHSLRLASVYDRTKPDGRREATTHQDYWLTVDYIYFSRCSALKPVARLRLPTAEECEALGKLPNHAIGSDHLALAAVFELAS